MAQKHKSFMGDMVVFCVTVDELAKMIRDQQLASRPFVRKYLSSAEEELP